MKPFLPKLREIIQKIDCHRHTLNLMKTSREQFLLDPIGTERLMQEIATDYNILQTELFKIRSEMFDDVYDSKTLIASCKNGVNDETKGLITERINDAYSWGIYGEFKVIIRNVDGFINGTHLIREATVFENTLRNKKNMPPLKEHEMKYWVRNDSTILLVDTLNYNVRFLTLKLIDPVKGKCVRGEEMIRGTYIHPRLVNSLATWVSPSYALIVGDLMNQHQLNAKMENEKKLVKKLRSACKKKDNALNRLTQMYNSISTNLQVSIEKSDILIKSLDEMKISNQNLSSKLSSTTNFITQIAPNIRPDTDPKNTHLFVVCRLNDSNFAFTHGVIRTIVRDYSKNKFSAKKKFPNIEIIRKFSSPNSIQIWNKIKANCKNIFADGNYFKILSNECEVLEEFASFIREPIESAQKICN